MLLTIILALYISLHGSFIVLIFKESFSKKLEGNFTQHYKVKIL